MGKGRKGKDEVVVKLLKHEESFDTLKDNKSGNMGKETHGKSGSDTVQIIPPGVPECDVVLKGSTRFWYLESALFLFGIVGVLISAVMLVWHYIHSSLYF